jgi:hypothetical protein
LKLTGDSIFWKKSMLPTQRFASTLRYRLPWRKSAQNGILLLKMDSNPERNGLKMERRSTEVKRGKLDDSAFSIR